MDMQNIIVVKVGETESLDSDGTYQTLYSVTNTNGDAIDMKALEEEANDRFQYRPRNPGAYFCSRVTVYPHPYLAYRAIVETEHQLDI